MEIERKFLFHKLPDHLDTYPHYGIEQAYVTTNPVIRVRKKTLYDAASAVSGCQYVLTVKSSGMLARQEFELPIDEAAYRTLCTKADGNVIAKTRYKIPLNQGLTLELDLFEGLFDGLVQILAQAFLFDQNMGGGNGAINKAGVIEVDLLLKLDKLLRVFDPVHIPKKRQPKRLALALFVAFAFPVGGKILCGLLLLRSGHSGHLIARKSSLS